jgi:hypothetical protein
MARKNKEAACHITDVFFFIFPNPPCYSISGFEEHHRATVFPIDNPPFIDKIEGIAENLPAGDFERELSTGKQVLSVS